MKTTQLRTFLATNAVDYDSLPYSGEHEAEHDYSHKRKWLRYGKASLMELAGNLSATPDMSINLSGSIDRGYVSGFLSKNGKVVYISLNDGMKDILYRTAEHTKDYTGGSNNTAPLTDVGFDTMIEWVKAQLNSNY